MSKSTPISSGTLFHGSLYFFYSFDIGDDIDLKSLHRHHSFARGGLLQSQFFRGYHKPLSLDIKSLNVPEYCQSILVYNFGAISLRYRFPFQSTLTSLRNTITNCDEVFAKNSIEVASDIFNMIKNDVRHPRFFHLSKSYALTHLQTIKDMPPILFKEKFGDEIVSVVRFETENLANEKKNAILEGAFGYYNGDFLLIDYNAALAYDDEHHDILDIFEFANIRSMELQFFDRSLDKELNFVYERQPYKIPIKAYFPLFGLFKFDPIGELAKLRVDIAVVSERLWSSIKFSDEPYYLEIYQILSKKLDFSSWQESIDKKMEVIRHILEVHDNRVSSIRYDLLNVLITTLIFIECILAIVQYKYK